MATNPGRRVALLASPGAACERVRGALNEIGADLVLEGDPSTLEPDTLESAHVQVLLVLLDSRTEDALDRFDAALSDPDIEVMFEEAEIVARREGWEAARWQRHLSAKLNIGRDVLPTVAQNDDAPFGAAAAENVGDAAPADVGDAVPVDAVDTSAEAPAAAGHPFDPVAAESGYEFDPVQAETGGTFGGLDFDPNAFALDAADTVAPQPAPAAPVGPEFDPTLVGLELEASLDEFTDTALELGLLDAATVGRAASGGDHGELFLDEPASGRPAAESPPGPAANGRERAGLVHDLDELNRRIASLSLLDDSPAEAAPEPSGRASFGEPSVPAAPPAVPAAAQSLLDSRPSEVILPATPPPVPAVAGFARAEASAGAGDAEGSPAGVVLVLAGIGGPDAVRQLLGALPEAFSRPVLVQQRLDGGRYDRLVAQMQRATRLPVRLAEAGQPAQPGHVYILPAEVGVEVAEAGVSFVFGHADKVVDRLSSADSAILLLSGADPALVDAVMHHAWAGALVAGQSPDGCYDSAAPAALLQRGGQGGSPAELAQRLSARWGGSASRLF